MILSLPRPTGDSSRASARSMTPMATIAAARLAHRGTPGQLFLLDRPPNALAVDFLKTLSACLAALSSEQA